MFICTEKYGAVWPAGAEEGRKMCITGLVDANGGAVVNYRYDSWGKLISITGSMAGTLGKDTWKGQSVQI